MIYIRVTASGYAALTYMVEKLSDGTFYDAAAGKFVAVTGTTYPAPVDLKARAGIFAGTFEANVAADPVIFPSGQYCVSIHRKDSGIPIAMFSEDYNPLTRMVIGGIIGSR